MNNFSEEIYTPYFCEENIWRLIQSLDINYRKNHHVLLLSNKRKSIALANQRAAQKEHIIIWDYHVVLYNSQTKEVFDFDTRLNFPEKLDHYLENTFGNQYLIPEEYQTYYRQIPAEVYLEHFSSDRKHMIDPSGDPIQPFPKWSQLSSLDPITLSDLLDFNYENELIPEYVHIDKLLK